MSKNTNNRHVVPNPGGGWDVKKPGAERASSHHDTQKGAIDRGREIVRGAGGVCYPSSYHTRPRDRF